MNFTTNHQLVLASSSPRRKELFSKLGVPFEVITSNVEETSVEANTVVDYVREVALLKARDVKKELSIKRLLVQIQLSFLKRLYYTSQNQRKKRLHI